MAFWEGVKFPMGVALIRHLRSWFGIFMFMLSFLFVGGLMFVGIVVGTLRRIVRFVMGLRGDRCGSMRRTGIS